MKKICCCTYYSMSINRYMRTFVCEFENIELCIIMNFREICGHWHAFQITKVISDQVNINLHAMDPLVYPSPTTKMWLFVVNLDNIFYYMLHVIIDHHVVILLALWCEKHTASEDTYCNFFLTIQRLLFPKLLLIILPLVPWSRLCQYLNYHNKNHLIIKNPNILCRSLIR